MKRAIALGFFDGVHVGHGELLNMAKQRAAEIGAVPSVLSFDVHPDTLVFNTDVPLITDTKGREEIIKRCFGIEDVVFIHFSKYVMQMPWDEFLDSIIQELDVEWIVCGHDFTFGKMGQGNATLLQQYCKEHGIGADVIPEVRIDGVTVSSTYIRTLISDGDIERANLFLGHPHCLSDTVHSGYHLGQKLDAPTINMFFPEGVIVPKHGVYATKAVLSDNKEYIAVTNIGVRPTVSNEGKVSVETHLLDFEGNLYNSPARIDFYNFIREEKKFDSLSKLSDQIKLDTLETRKYFEICSA